MLMDLLQKLWPALVVWGVMFGIWLLLRVRGNHFGSASEFDRELSDDRTKVLEFFSNG